MFPPDFKNGLKYLSAEGAKRFKKKFLQCDEMQKQHMLIELIVAVHGKNYGYMPVFEPKLGGQTPDWLFTDKAGVPQFFAEVFTRHGEERIWGKVAVVGPMDEIGPILNKADQLDDLPDGAERLTDPIGHKAIKYKKLVEQQNLPFVLCLYSCPELFLYPGRIMTHLKGEKDTPLGAWMRTLGLKEEPEPPGVLINYPHVSGLWSIELDQVHSLRYDDGCHYGFLVDFYRNEHATRPITLSDRWSVGVPIPEPSQ